MDTTTNSVVTSTLFPCSSRLSSLWTLSLLPPLSHCPSPRPSRATFSHRSSAVVSLSLRVVLAWGPEEEEEGKGSGPIRMSRRRRRRRKVTGMEWAHDCIVYTVVRASVSWWDPLWSSGEGVRRRERDSWCELQSVHIHQLSLFPYQQILRWCNLRFVWEALSGFHSRQEMRNTRCIDVQKFDNTVGEPYRRNAYREEAIEKKQRGAGPKNEHSPKLRPPFRFFPLSARLR